MVRNRTIRIGAVVAAAIALAWARPTFSQAQGGEPAGAADAQYDEWVATYGRWTPAQAELAGYLPTDVCVTAAAVGLPPEAGAMGRHFVHPGYIEDGKADADAPDIVLFDAGDRVVGLEFELLTVVDPIPSVGGVPMVLTPPDPGVDQDHLSLHVYFVGDAADRHTTFNPAVDCGGTEGTVGDRPDADAAEADAAEADAAGTGGADANPAAEAPPQRPKMVPVPPVAMPGVVGPSAAAGPAPSTAVTATLTMSDTEAIAPEPDAHTTSVEPAAAVTDTAAVSPYGGSRQADSAAGAGPAAVTDPDTMPVAGAGDWLPGGDSTLFGALAGGLVLLAAAGWLTAARRA